MTPEASEGTQICVEICGILFPVAGDLVHVRWTAGLTEGQDPGVILGMWQVPHDPSRQSATACSENAAPSGKLKPLAPPQPERL
jgi:hypothetical protein